MRRGSNKSSVKKHSGKGQVRIIAGHWRGRKLTVPEVEGLRPTPDRIRETLFNWLSSVVAEADCMDLFCGSGALGFEAASRGAKTVTMIDLDPLVITQIKSNRDILDATTVQVEKADVIKYLDGPAIAKDIVMIDPPFGKNLVAPTVAKLEANGWLKFNSYIYIETETNLVELAVPFNWVLHREKKVGEVFSRLYIRTPED